jgi:catechol 2,3-dioxygenase-like lactoylglutathione lyase family enzyme
MESAKLLHIAPEIPVSSLKDAVEYYEQKLGFRLAMDMPDQAYAIVERDDIAVYLFREDAPRHSRVGIHIFTENLDVLQAELKDRGAHLSQGIKLKPWGNRDFRVHDNSGNEIKFTEPRLL